MFSISPAPRVMSTSIFFFDRISVNSSLLHITADETFSRLSNIRRLVTPSIGSSLAGYMSSRITSSANERLEANSL